MIRFSDIGMLAIAVSGAIYTYQIKHQAEVAAKHLAGLTAQIEAQNRKIALLEADWALEIDPARLEKIAARHSDQLQLKPMESSQLIDISELPGFRLDRDPVSEETYAKKDGQTITGGIGELIEREGEN